MKKEKKEDIIDKFKKLESELISLLVEPFNFDEIAEQSDMKAKLKKYIEKVKKASEVFEQYEMTATEIEKLLGGEEETYELSSSVVDLRENKDQKVMPTIDEFEKQKQEKKRAKSKVNSEYRDELEVVDGAPVLIRKKKKTKSQSTREM